MKTFVLIFFLGVTFTQQALAQFSDNFSDNDLTSNPTWSGSTSDFIVNANQKLQLFSSTAATSSITTPFAASTLGITEWTMLVNFTFAPSSTSYGRIYLVSNQSNLSGSLNGYYLQFGEANATDAIELFRQTGTISTSVCRGNNGTIANSNFNVRVKVTRDQNGLWTILTDYTGGTNFAAEASGTDVTHQSSSFFGVRCTYALTNSQKFFFDDFSITTLAAPDLTPPVVSSVDVVSSTQLDVTFSEPLNTPSAEEEQNYLIGTDLVNPSSGVIQANQKTVRLTFPQPFTNGVTQALSIQNVKDISLNSMQSVLKTFLYFQPSPSAQHDIIISELLPDPSPALGLPEAEFVELFNRSQKPFDLAGWQITDGTSTGTLSSLILLPGEYLILSSSSTSTLFQAFGKKMGLATWPSLNNSGDLIKIKNPQGKTIDSVSYALSWYRSDEKKDGGYSLEKIDPENFCKGSENWIATSNPSGGTPGQQNSMFQILPDLQGPKLLSLVSISATRIQLNFDERLSNQATETSNFSVMPLAIVDSIYFSNTQQTTLLLDASAPLDSVLVYTVNISNIRDCPGNLIQDNLASASFRLDMISPTLLGITAVNDRQLKISFSEKISPQAANESNYVLANRNPISAVLQTDQKSVIVSFEDRFVNGVSQTISIKNISDPAGNAMTETGQSFLYFDKKPSHARDVIINEIFADPTPPVGMPEAEFVEIYNRSNDPFNLKDWTFADGTSVHVLPDFILLPQTYLILTLTSKASLFSTLGPTLGVVGFPSLNNTGESLVLRDEKSALIDSLNYSDKWYGSNEKKDGGWTMERIDPENFCRGSDNWIASNSASGGTPGQQNSVFQITPDLTGPELLEISAPSPAKIEIQFDEKLSSSSISKANVSSSPAFTIDSMYLDKEMRKIGMVLSQQLDSATLYTVTISNIYDCPGNEINAAKATISFKLDSIKPAVSRIEAINSRQLRIVFSEKIQSPDVSNFRIGDGLFPTLTQLLSDHKSVLISFPADFQNGVVRTLYLRNILDRANNVMNDSEKPFLFFEKKDVRYKDIVISEIFADPAPSAGLPEVEYIEIYNRSDSPVNLEGWSLADGNSKTSLSSTILLPREYIILCSASKANQFGIFGKTLGVISFPSITNSGEPITLRSDSNLTVDSVNFSLTYYHDDEKKDGGWSIELIDPDNTCAESSNWTSSEDPSGGTPGKVNSVLASKPDLTGPKLLSAFASGANVLILKFDEKLEKTLPDVTPWTFQPDVSIADIRFTDPSLTTFTITTLQNFSGGILYSIALPNVFDCSGNRIQDGFQRASFALPESADSLDILINEILFNPRPTGVDFVELYNNSTRYVNLKDWKTVNARGDEKVISEIDKLMAPGEFLVLTTDANVLKGEYLQGREETFLDADLPAMNDDEGSVTLVDELENVIDAMEYTESFHSPFLQEKEGVSLERIAFHSPEDVKSNWKSASSSSGFATPGYRNSNSFEEAISDQAVSILPEIFAPENGQPGFAEINYNFDKGGFIANVKVLDARGRAIKQIASNELIGPQGFFRWDGDMDNGSRARLGSYLIWFEIFDETGELKTFRKRVVVAAKS